MGASDHWYKNSVVYGVDVETFADSDGDGVGDFEGLTERLGYVSRLGVNCVWLLPFFPSPNRDNGYDVTDYFGVHPRYGTLGDFAEFMTEAETHGLRVVLDLPVNHTSDQHPWFQKAREGHDRYRDYYVWVDDPEAADVDVEPIFPGQENEVWTYDEAADAYYFHRFYDFQPGLNYANPDVREEVRRILGYWLRLGVDGFRLDAASHMISAKGLESARPDDPHGVFRNFREFVATRNRDAILVGEADVEADRLDDYFGDGDELTMLYNFLLANYLFLGLARESAEPVVQGLRLLPSPPTRGQWLNFLRNLDELDLERLTESERESVFEAFAPDDEMRIYGRGTRRRLAPMLDGDRDRLELAFSLLFSMPGTPMFVYGDELGMGDDLSLPGRNPVRTPMQWSPAENAGFSTADAADLVRPVIDEGPFGYERVNVADQQRDPESLLNWMQRLVYTRRQHPEFGWGDLDVVETEPPGALVHRCGWEDSAVLAAHNLADEETTVSFDLTGDPRLVDVFADRQYERVDGDSVECDLDGYGYRWFRVGSTTTSPHRSWEEID
jgi:maltose alpha-D-glucosyltransferase/alpha-amylase